MERGSGVAPSRLSTPYCRSKPVAIAWPVNAVDMTASATTPGVKKSTRATSVRVDLHEGQRRQHDEQADRHDQAEQHLLAVAQQQHQLGTGLRGEHRRGAAPAPGRGASEPGAQESGASRAQLPPGQLEEDVLEGAALQPQVLDHHAVPGAPGGDRGQQLRVQVALDEVRAGRRLLGRAADGQRQQQLVEVEAGLGPPAQLAGGARCGSGRAPSPAATTRPRVDDDDVVGQPLGLVHEVRGEHDGDAVAAQRLDEVPGRQPGLRVEARRWARRGTPARAGRRRPAPATAAAPGRRTAGVRPCARTPVRPRRSSRSAGSSGSRL